jgi:hypothetical protein
MTTWYNSAHAVRRPRSLSAARYVSNPQRPADATRADVPHAVLGHARRRARRGRDVRGCTLRELREEVGRDDLELGPWIWTRYVEFSWEDQRIRQLERTYFVTAPKQFEPVVVDAGIEPIVGGRWLTQKQIASLPEIVYPVGLGDLVRQLIQDGLPPDPIDLGSTFEAL